MKSKIIACLILMLTLTSCSTQKNEKSPRPEYNFNCNSFVLGSSDLVINAASFNEHLVFVVNQEGEQLLAEYLYEENCINFLKYKPPESHKIEYIFDCGVNGLWSIERDVSGDYFLKRIGGASKYEAMLDIDDGHFIYSMCFSQNGFVFAVTDSNIIIFDINEGKSYVLRRPVEDCIGICAISSSDIYLIGANGTQNCIIPIDLELFEFKKPISMSRALGSIFPGDLFDCDFCFYDDESLYGFCMADREFLHILNWRDYGITGNSIVELFFSKHESIICLSYSIDGEYVVSEFSLSSSKNETTELVLATYSASADLLEHVAKFNRENSPDCRIRVVDYSNPDIYQDLNNGLMRFNTEIISGQYPDIIDFSNMRSLVEPFASKGLLVDLYGLIDKDYELDRSSFVESVIKLLEKNNALYEAVPSFSISTIVAPVSLSESGKTELPELIIQAKNGIRLFDIGDSNELMRATLYGTINSYIVPGNNGVTFEADSFSSLLELFFYLNNNKSEPQTKPLLYYAGISDFLAIQKYETIIDEEIAFVGFPCCVGSGNSAYISQSLAIVSKCKNIDDAWAFVRSIFTEEYQSSLKVGEGWLSFPTNKNTMNKMIHDSMRKDYFIENGVAVEKSKGGEASSEYSVTYYAATQKHIEKTLELIESVDCVFSYDNATLVNLILEEVQPYLAGNKDINETVKLVQGKVQLYLSEREL